MERAETARAVQVLLVEDHAPIRQAIASEFEPDPDFEIVGQAGSLAEARGMLASADVAILDLGLPDGSGVDLIPELRAVNPQALAVALSASHDPTLQARAVELGAAAVLDKAGHLGQVAQAVRRVLSDERLMPAEDGPLQRAIRPRACRSPLVPGQIRGSGCPWSDARCVLLRRSGRIP